VSDIFQEVEEEVRRERFEQLWKQYGDYIIAGACLLVIGAAGIQLWRTYEHNQYLKASDQYAAAEEMAESGQPALAAQAFGHLADTAPGGYRVLARLQHADALLASGQREDALSLYKEIANGGDPLMGDVARVRAAWAEADYLPRSDVAATLGGLTDPASPWHAFAMEILAYDDYRNNATKAALGEYQALADDPKTNQSVRERASVMASFLKAGGDSNYGTVPPLPAKPDASAAGAPSATTPGPTKP
jgi:hypothetical protein